MLHLNLTQTDWLVESTNGMLSRLLCSLAYQRMSWEALKKSINGLINKVNVSNIVNIIQELLQENIVRGRYDAVQKEHFLVWNCF